MRDVDLIPDWLTEGLVETEKDKEKERQGGVDQLWQKVDVGDVSMIVRAAKRKSSSIPVRRVK
jgi:hypothetical protein